MTAGWNLTQTYADLPPAFHAATPTAKFSNPKLVWFNRPLATQLGLRPDDADDGQWASWFAGQSHPDFETNPTFLAMAYAGHQFGGFTMLGDGRAMLIGEQVGPGDHQSGDRYDIQLKGGGRTPFARRGDGLAVLGPMLREAIMAESIHALGIPTTRSLAVVTTGDPVFRNGPEPGAVLTRVATSHLRVGTMQYAAARGSEGDADCHADQITLADYIIDRHHRDLSGAAPADRYLQLLQRTIDQQSDLIARWMSIGFIHGVMNTDNMALSGQTIDYGPCAMMDRYDPATVFSSIDTGGRYAYQNQPSIAHWNLTRFAESLIPIIASQTGPPTESEIQTAIESATETLATFPDRYQQQYDTCFARKIGFESADDVTRSLVTDLLDHLQTQQLDFIGAFRSLSGDHPLAPESWLDRWRQHQQEQAIAPETIRQILQTTNPAVIPRNAAVEHALTAATAGDLAPLETLSNLLQTPFNAPPKNIDPTITHPPPKNAPRHQTYCGT